MSGGKTWTGTLDDKEELSISPILKSLILKANRLIEDVSVWLFAKSSL